MRRLIWKLLYPIAVLSHRIFGTSYKWVNVGIGAWNRESFDPLWQHRWYGEEIADLPVSVNLCGARHEVAVSEGLVVFRSRDYWTRVEFTRDPHDRYGFLWYVTIIGNVPATTVENAYQWVKAVYGGSHELKRPALRNSVEAK